MNSFEESIIKLLQERNSNDDSTRFFVDPENVLLSGETGEKAGVIDLTEDFACAYKIDSVYVGYVDEIDKKFAETAGKVYREISVVGSQPLASLLSISTGEAVSASEHQIFDQAIKDISNYGNIFGVPVASVDARKNDSNMREMTASILSLGLIDKSEQLNSVSYYAGNLVYLVGAPDTGDRPEKSAFVTRSLYELVCDMHEEKAIVAIKNINYGGIVCACADIVVEGTKGIELDTDVFDDDFPRHPADMFLSGELKLTECIPGKLIMVVRYDLSKELEKACHKWNMRCMQIGKTIEEPSLKVMKGEESVVELSKNVLLTNKLSLPEKNVDWSPGASLDTQSQASANAMIPEENRDVARFLATWFSLEPMQKLAEQFDSTVGTNNLSTNFISDAAVFQIKGERHALAASFCRSFNDIIRYPDSINVALADSLRRVICSGGKPMVMTGCLVYSGTLNAKTINALNDNVAAFCKKMKLATSGLNIQQTENSGKVVIHNLSTGTIAFMDDKHQQMTVSFKSKGDMIYMIGKSSSNLDSSEYLRHYHHEKNSPPQQIDLDTEANVLSVAQELIARKFVKSAHSVSRGGLFMALLEAAMIRSFGFDITSDDEIRKDAFLFGEAPSRIVVSVSPTYETSFIDYMMKTNVPFITLGHVTREEIRIDDCSYGFISDFKKKRLVGQ